MQQSSIKAVLFDLDNTLTHRNQSIDAFSRYFVRRYNGWLVPTSAETVSDLIKAVDQGGYGCAANPYPSIKRSVAKSLHSTLSWKNRPDETELLNCWVQQFPLNSQPMPGARALLQQLRLQGYKIGIVSNGLDTSRLGTIKALGFTDFIDTTLSSERAGAKKPEVSIFHQAANELGVKPDECLFVGDHPINDIAGSIAAGMQPLWLSGFHSWPDQTETIKAIHSLSEIQPFLVPGRWSDYVKPNLTRA